ncbi:MAG: hypothetical protein HQ453_10355 [Actinobacteria bacterium]|nr:hypothetical protein [Actinomycetota bacterium]
MAKQGNDQPSGVRGPGGPPPIPPKGTAKPAARGGSSGGSSKPARSPKLSNPSSPARSALETKSYPLLVTLQRVPRWVMVVLPAALLFLGLIQTGGLAWLGGILLLLVAVFLAWLLVLSWPVLTIGSRTLRLVTVVAVVGIAVFKFMGRI